ncbi:titin-like isoform X3 [Stylophora pistillata]|uniref:titin-like isoform X3 n=1 Tax=Stylophora pistillata TaxID=50429 RepID=UPI000C03B4A6|nr:titin-like isoform X3 [Stylophora pistillata]
MKVFARNSIFEGDPAVKILKTEFEGPLEVVKIDELPIETKDDTIALKWKEPGSNGKVIMQYTVYQRTVTDGKMGDWKKIEKTTDVKDRQLEVKLKKGEVYEFAVTATNALGEGLKQDAFNIKRVKAIGIPAAVEIYGLPSETTEDTITLRWIEPKDNGKKITQYTVYQRTIVDGIPRDWTVIKEISDAKVREIKVKLERGKVYQFSVTATNDVGESQIPDKRNIPRVKAVERKREVYLRATINENCSRRLFVAAKFPNVACELVVNHSCFAALTVDSRYSISHHRRDSTRSLRMRITSHSATLTLRHYMCDWSSESKSKNIFTILPPLQTIYKPLRKALPYKDNLVVLRGKTVFKAFYRCLPI